MLLLESVYVQWWPPQINELLVAATEERGIQADWGGGVGCRHYFFVNAWAVEQLKDQLWGIFLCHFMPWGGGRTDGGN